MYLYPTIIYVISLLVFSVYMGLLVKKKLPFWIGKAGETFFTKQLNKLSQKHYKILNSILIPAIGNLTNTEVDHVVVSNFGIFCIETKTYKGEIVGDSKEPNWTQVINKYVNKINNPMRQNYSHKLAIESLISEKFPNAKVYSLIVFLNSDQIRVTGTRFVGSPDEMIQLISEIRTFIISDSERDEIYEMLKSSNIQDKRSRKIHEKEVKRYLGGFRK